MAERGPYHGMLGDDEVRRIHPATLDLMENVGVKFTLPEAQAIFREAGLRVGPEGVAHFEPGLVEEAIRKAPARFTRPPLAPTARPVQMGDGCFHDVHGVGAAREGRDGPGAAAAGGADGAAIAAPPRGAPEETSGASRKDRAAQQAPVERVANT